MNLKFVQPSIGSVRASRSWMLGLALALGVMGTAVSVPSQAQAQTAAPALKVAVVDLNEAMNSVDEGKAAIATLEKRFTAKKADLEKQQKELQDMQSSLERQASVLTEDAMRKKSQELQTKYAAFQQNRMQAEQEMAGMRAQLQDDLAEKLKKVCATIATQNGYTLIVEKNVVWYSAPAYDITAQLIKAYNAQAKPAAAAPKK